MVRVVRQMPREKGTTGPDEEDPKQEGAGITPDAAKRSQMTGTPLAF